ncbi:MAG: TIGR01440 family protein [Clostridiales bacterium]|jgi:uncharacterized protein (TIGR01440 family)|nr:TIGR01440 family protein [Clostridiales bacterium]
MPNNIEADLKTACNELIEKAGLRVGNILVLGCSSSEVNGGEIGKQSSYETGALIVETLLAELGARGIYLAVQGCEHINRSIVIEKEIAEKRGFEIVMVVPKINAGGACALAAYERFKEPVMVEHIVADAGMDIGDTSIGMHVKFVQVPVRLSVKKIGGAHLTCLKSRPKFIGGERSSYNFD